MMASSEIGRTAVGRTRALLVFGLGPDARGLVVTVNVAVAGSGDAAQDRLLWQGPVTLSERAREHLSAVVLPTVDRLTEILGLSPRRYHLSCSNPGAASTHDLGVSITGFSADVPIVLAMLSAALQMPMDQGLASTGHLASLEGDIAQVRGLPEKIQAALEADGISGVIVPDPGGDQSLRSLSPREYQRARASIKHAEGAMEIFQVGKVADLVEVAFSEEALVMGSLQSGYFSTGPRGNPDSGSPILRAAWLLSEGNEKRFWRAMEARLLAGEYVAARRLLQARAHHHLQKGRYPSGFGAQLRSLAISIPPSRRRDRGCFPLLPMSTCISLSNLATEPDHGDVRLLYQAAFADDLPTSGRVATRAEPVGPDAADQERDGSAKATLEALLSRISPQAIARVVGRPVDEARSRYQIDSVVVEDPEAFHECLISFYAHMMRHTHETVGRPDPEAMLGEALELLERAFGREGGYKAALVESQDGTQGGLRHIFDRLTEELKRQQTARYAHLVFTEMVDALDWEARVALMSAFLERIGPSLPSKVRDGSPERYAANYEPIIRYYVESLDQVTRLLAAL